MKKLILLIAFLLITNNCFAGLIQEPVTIQVDSIQALKINDSTGETQFRFDTLVDSPYDLDYKLSIFDSQVDTHHLHLGNLGLMPIDTPLQIGRDLTWESIEAVGIGIHIMQYLLSPHPDSLYGIFISDIARPQDYYNIGIHSSVSGAQNNIAIKGSAPTGVGDWAGYFSGNVYIDGDIYYTGKLFNKRLEELEKKVYEIEKEYEIKKAFYQLNKKQ